MKLIKLLIFDLTFLIVEKGDRLPYVKVGFAQ